MILRFTFQSLGELRFVTDTATLMWESVHGFSSETIGNFAALRGVGYMASSFIGKMSIRMWVETSSVWRCHVCRWLVNVFEPRLLMCLLYQVQCTRPIPIYTPPPPPPPLDPVWQPKAQSGRFLDQGSMKHRENAMRSNLNQSENFRQCLILEKDPWRNIWQYQE